MQAKSQQPEVHVFSCDEVAALIDANCSNKRALFNGEKHPKSKQERAAWVVAKDVSDTYSQRTAGLRARGLGSVFFTRALNKSEFKYAAAFVIYREGHQVRCMDLAEADLSELAGGFEEFCSEIGRFARAWFAEIEGEFRLPIYETVFSALGFVGEGFALEEAAELSAALYGTVTFANSGAQTRPPAFGPRRL